MRKTLLITCVALLVLPLTADAQNRHRQRIENECSLQLILRELPREDLTVTETLDLQFMREEEKFARDVYLSLHETREVRIFRVIARQERVHMNAVRTLLRKYDLEDTAAGMAIGEFTNASLATLYGDFVSLGSLSLADALAVGMLVEEMDILDLQTALESTDNEDIATLYQNLMNGSRNHLRAFARRLAAEDPEAAEEYEAQYLPQTELDTIVSSPKEKGGVLDADGNYLCGTTQNRRGQN